MARVTRLENFTDVVLLNATKQLRIDDGSEPATAMAAPAMAIQAVFALVGACKESFL